MPSWVVISSVRVLLVDVAITWVVFFFFFLVFLAVMMIMMMMMVVAAVAQGKVASCLQAAHFFSFSLFFFVFSFCFLVVVVGRFAPWSSRLQLFHLQHAENSSCQSNNLALVRLSVFQLLV